MYNFTIPEVYQKILIKIKIKNIGKLVNLDRL